MDYTQDISKFKDLVYEIKNAIKQSVNKSTKPAQSTQPTTPTQPSTQPQADTFYNLKDFSDEQKFSILDNMISRNDATTEEDAIEQLNKMLATDKQFAIEYMKSCLT